MNVNQFWKRRSDGRKAFLNAMARRADYRVTQLAELMECSPRQLRRYVREDFGESPRAWLRRLRLEAARVALLDVAAQAQPTAISRVARRMGYTSTSNFTRDFRRQYGETPGTFLVRNFPPPMDGSIDRTVPGFRGNPPFPQAPLRPPIDP